MHSFSVVSDCCGFLRSHVERKFQYEAETTFVVWPAGGWGDILGERSDDLLVEDAP